MGEIVFAQCSQLNTVIVKWNTPLSVNTNVFNEVSLPAATLFVPAGTKLLYEAADVWKDFGTIIEQGGTDPCATPIASGTTGDLTWTLCPDGTLTISGAGAMPDYERNDTPWNLYQEQIITVVIEQGVSSIGNWAFGNYNRLTSFTIPNSITRIGDYAFWACYLNLNTLTIPENVTSIGHSAFKNNEISSIIMPDGVINIGIEAFAENNRLTSVTIPKSVVNYESGTFYDCKNLTSINVDSENNNFSSEDGVVFNKNKTTLIECPNGKIGDYTIPSSVTNIGPNAINSCSKLTSIIIPETVTAIKEWAFMNCSSLTSISIPKNVAYIGPGVFTGCTSLTSINVNAENNNYIDQNGVLFDKSQTAILRYPIGKTGNSYDIPNTVTHIEFEAFSNCNSLISIEIPAEVTNIGELAFWNCINLDTLIVKSTVPISINANVFNGITISDITLLVPSGTKSLYEAADVWKDFGTIVEQAPPTVAVTSISLDKTELNLLVDSTAQLIATILPEDATNNNVTWSSSNEAIASVSATGLVTALAEGAATITVTTEDGGFTATCTVTVTRPLSSDATLSNLAVNAGTLTPQFSPNTTGYTVVVENSTESIVITATKNHAAATVSGDGTKSLSVGENTFDITVTAEDRTQKVYTIKVTREAVTIVAVTSVSLDKTEANLLIGATEQLTATVLPEDATNKNVTWSSSNEAIAFVSADGLVTAWAEGVATITVTTEDGGFTAACTVTVARPLSSDATLSNLAVNAGTLTPQFSPNTTGYTVVVENSTDSITIMATKNHAAATVSGAGTHSLSVGENTFDITVTAEDGTQRIYTIKVTRETPAVEVNETEPAGANGTGKFELSLTVPANVLFSGSFTLTLPNGFHLDLSQTKLSDDLSGQLTLTFTQNADGSWLFTIGVKEGLRNKTDNVYQKLVDIVYTIDESIANGNYEAHIQDLSFVFEDNTRIEEAEIPVNVTVDHSYTNIPSVSASVQVYVYKQILYVDTPLAERINIYSMTGKLLYNIEKPAGKISFAVNRPERILIVKGSSGWVQKVIL
jgi:uncharacterized protein YjdB